MAAFKHIILAFAFLSAVAAQNCGLTGVTDSTINIPIIDETTPAEIHLWSQETYNVTASAAITHPHVKYISGLRYSTKYEYVTNELTSTFVQTERANSIRRDVIFTCSDGKNKAYTFIFEINDQNTEAPEFVGNDYGVVFNKSSNSSEPLNANVVVTDDDFELKNAQLVMRSSNAFVTPFVQPLWEGDHPYPYSYQMDFVVSSALEVGQYYIILTADDGKFSDSATLTLNVVA